MRKAISAAVQAALAAIVLFIGVIATQPASTQVAHATTAVTPQLQSDESPVIPIIWPWY